MASNLSTGSAGNYNKEPLDPFTLQGYIKMFDDEKGGSDVLHQLISLYDKYTYETWTKKLIDSANFESVKSLIDLNNIKITKRPEFVNLREIFFLLENVFRNVILRPYVPAYRSINMDCGRYRSFVIPLKNFVPFDKLNFRQTSSNLLTYVGTDSYETMMCAHACAYFYFTIKQVVDDHDKKNGQYQQQQSSH